MNTETVTTSQANILIVLKGIDYNALVQNQELFEKVIAQSKASVFKWIPDVPEHLGNVEICAGSVRLSITISPPPGTLESTMQQLKQGESAIRNSLVAGISSIPGIEQVASGPIAASGFQLSSPGITSAQPATRELSSTDLVIAVVIGVSMCLICCVGSLLLGLQCHRQAEDSLKSGRHSRH